MWLSDLSAKHLRSFNSQTCVHLVTLTCIIMYTHMCSHTRILSCHMTIDLQDELSGLRQSVEDVVKENERLHLRIEQTDISGPTSMTEW